MSAPDTSSISFTAHYTGYVWYHVGWSDAQFVTPQGKTYFSLMQPLEFVARHIVGSDVCTTLVTRHALIDRELETLINAGATQVLEIACGLSPRGWRMRQKHPGIKYVEADLPGMVQRKRALLSKLGTLGDQHKVVNINILANSGSDSLESVLAAEFDTSQPVIVITEGLVNYFDLPAITGFWKRLHKAMTPFANGHYLTDVYPRVSQHPFFPVIRAANELLRVASRSRFTLHFDSNTAAVEHFQSIGYHSVQVFDPNLDLSEPGLPHAKGGSIVRVIHARTTH